jgi:hypothetical protein
MNVNTKYKNSVFSLLFSNPDALRELYGAIEGVVLPPDTSVDINTLSGVLYMDQINDLSFIIGNLLVVIMEHQSSINPNMPLRLLIYIAHIYEKIIDRKLLYKTKLEKIPTPEFIVLYNGKEPYPDRSTLRLSDAFKDACGLLGVETPAPSLELVVQVYNINHGHNAEILEKSRSLGGYSAFVGKVREYAQAFTLEEAMKEAVKYCMDNDILKTFLETHSSEVFNMLLTEWDTEEAKVVWREEGREEGREEKGIEIVRNALAEGFSIETVQKITGIDIKSIQNIQADAANS